MRVTDTEAAKGWGLDGVVTWVWRGAGKQERVKAEWAADKTRMAELKATLQEAQQAVRWRDEAL